MRNVAVKYTETAKEKVYNSARRQSETSTKVILPTRKYFFLLLLLGVSLSNDKIQPSIESTRSLTYHSM